MLQFDPGFGTGGGSLFGGPFFRCGLVFAPAVDPLVPFAVSSFFRAVLAFCDMRNPQRTVSYAVSKTHGIFLMKML